MPRSLPDPDRYQLGHLFGPWETVEPATETHSMPAKPRSDTKPARLRVSVYGGSQGRGDAAQMVATVREVLLARLDDLGATRLWPIAQRCGVNWECWLEAYQEMLLCLFPVECGDGEAYMPDPAKRQDVPAPAKVRKGGLFPYPCEGVGDARSIAFARFLLIGQSSPAARISTPEGRPLFSDAELARLGERIARREAAGRAVG